LFATADSVTTARLVGTAPTGYSEDAALHAKAWEALHISAVFEQADEFDLIPNSFEAAAAYTTAALEGLRRAGCLGAFLWCYSDYDPALAKSPPFDLAPHERTFGLWRIDGSPKPAVAAIAAFVGAERCTPGLADAWIDIDRDEFLLDPNAQLPRLYRRYREQSKAEQAMSGMTD
jgi:hypothetical protein